MAEASEEPAVAGGRCRRGGGGVRAGFDTAGPARSSTGRNTALLAESADVAR